MIYNDGVLMDNEQKVTICPRCENEVMSDAAKHCKICGLSLYNYCKGKWIEDYNYEDQGYLEQHKNVSDARFCETCGESTTFFKENILQPWEQLIGQLTNTHSEVNTEQEDLPF